MEKKKFSFKSPEMVKILVGDQEIEVVPYLDVETQVVLTKSYIDNYFSQSVIGIEKDVVMAEHSLKLALLDLCTDVDVSEISINDILSNYVTYMKIIRSIVNYEEFRRTLSEIVSNIKEEEMKEKSIGFVLENIYAKALEFFENLSSMELSEENIGKIGKLLKEAEESPLLNSLAKNLVMGVPKQPVEKKIKTPKKKEMIQ